MTGKRPLMLTSWYPDAKRAARGELATAPEYGRFVCRFEGRFGFAPVWVAQVEDYGQAKTCVVVERSVDAQMFRAHVTVDLSRPVADRRIIPVWSGGVDLHQVVRKMLRPTVTVPLFRDFEEPARHEVHDSVTDAELEDWVISLALGDHFAKLVRPWGEPPVVVVHTTAQRCALREAGVLEEWAARYYLLAQRRDEFGYLDRARVSIGIDSLEDWRAGRSSERGYYA